MHKFHESSPLDEVEKRGSGWHDLAPSDKRGSGVTYLAVTSQKIITLNTSLGGVMVNTSKQELVSRVAPLPLRTSLVNGANVLPRKVERGCLGLLSGD